MRGLLDGGLSSIFILLAIAGDGTESVEDAAGGDAEALPKVPLPALEPFPSAVGELCRRDSETYLTELRNLTLWAAKMFDSYGKLPTGVLFGATHEFGNYEECISVERKVTEFGEGDVEVNGTGIRGQYCLAEIKVTAPPTPKDRNTSSSQPSIWDETRELEKDPSTLSRTNLHWGVCVPDSCTSDDVQIHLEHALRPLVSSLAVDGVEPKFTVNVEPDMCTSRADEEVGDDPLLSIGQIIMCAIIAGFVTLVVLASLLELFEGKTEDGKDIVEKGIVTRTLRCFSSITNVKRLTSKADSTEPLAFINGIKLMTMFLIIFGHRFIFNTASPLSNPEYVETLYRRFDTLILLGGTVVVDTFLIISGCLLVVLLLAELRRNPKLSVLCIYIHRFLRLTPLYMIVIGFYATLFPRIGDGPTWKAKVGRESEYCAENWWTNLLYINTFVNPDRMCMIQSWYMAVDMHLFMIGVPITFLLHRQPKLGKACLAGVTVVSATIAFALTYLQRLDPILLVYFKTLLNLREDPTFKYSYIQSYMRALPYFLGMIIGYLVHEAHKTNTKIPTRLKPPLLALTLISSFAPIFGSMVFLNPEHDYDPLTAAIFNPIHRLVWALGMGIVIFAEATDSSYPVTKILRWRTMVPLSRITYSAFLIHAGVQIYSVNTRRIAETASLYLLCSTVVADACHTFIFAFLFSVVFEAPMLRLEKLILEKAHFAEADATEFCESVCE